jgi:4a-hydroxytetrahydrobiopterin dehydratase
MANTADSTRQRSCGGELAGLAGLGAGGTAIRRTFTFTDFTRGRRLRGEAGIAAEAADSPPDIDIRYKRVTLAYSTHSEGGLTEKDFAGADRRRRNWRAGG